MKLFSLLAALSAFAAFGYEGPLFDVTVWRGETAAVEMPAWAESEMLDAVSSEKAVSVRVLAVDPVWSRFRPRALEAYPRADVVRPDAKLTSALPAKRILEVAVATDAKAGEYVIGAMRLKVIDRVLPPAKDWKYHLDLWQHPWAVARYFGVEPFSDAHYEKMRPIWRTLASAGVKSLTTTLVDYPWNHQCYDGYRTMIGRVRNADGSWKFDYSVFDKYVEFGRECGIGPDIACYTLCTWGYAVRWTDGATGKTMTGSAHPGTKEFADFWGDFLVDFAAHLKSKGWFENVYLAMDERSPEDVKAVGEFVRAKAPGLKIAMAGNRNPNDFGGIVIDDYSQILAHVTPDFLNVVRERRSAGLRTTYYVCCWPLKPNCFMMSAEDESFWLGAYPAISGFDGFLRWAANSWPRDPYVDAAFGDWTDGDSFLVYPRGEASLRLVNLRAGIIAAEKVRILANEQGVKDAIDKLAEKYDCGKAMKGEVSFGDFRREMNAAVNR